MTQHALLSANISRQFTQHINVAFWVKGGEQVNKAKNAEKFLQFMKKEDFRLFSKRQLYKCIYSWL